ncbi:cysteine desulfurase [Clostridia bacterium]|nr:cysteine desulfurase [Clostridia bacterium]
MIYLDSAATTMQKPPEVFRAMRKVGRFGGAGRGGHHAAMAAAQAIYDCRELACDMFGASSPERVILTSNATHALNIAVKTLVKPHSTVLTTGYEHNAVARPLHALNVATTTVPTDRVDAIVWTHVSNVFGTVFPVEPVAELAKKRGIPLIIDAAQSAGILSLDAEKLGAVLCMPGHKALYGPQGTGLLIVPSYVELTPLIQGGTGSSSLSLDMPNSLPDSLEAGTQNAWGAAGLAEGLRYVQKRGTEDLRAVETRLLTEAINQLAGFATLYTSKLQCGVLSMTFPGMDVEDIAARLSEQNIAVRAGLQCAPTAHRTMNTLPGTLRVSFSAFNTIAEVRKFAKILRSVLT